MRWKMHIWKAEIFALIRTTRGPSPSDAASYCVREPARISADFVLRFPVGRKDIWPRESVEEKYRSTRPRTGSPLS